MRLRLRNQKIFNAIVFSIVISMAFNDETTTYYEQGDKDSKCDMFINQDYLVANCINKGLKEIPKNLNISTEYILCGANPIIEIRRSVLQQYKNLTFFGCPRGRFNGLTKIDPDAFVDLKYLRLIDIRFYRVESEVSLIFPPSVEILLVSYTNLTRSLNVSNLKHLKKIQLQYSLVSEFPEIYFRAPLEQVISHGNHLKNIPVEKLAQFCKLKELTLSAELTNNFLESCDCLRLKEWARINNITFNGTFNDCNIGMRCRKPLITLEMNKTYEDCINFFKPKVVHGEKISWHKFIGLMVALVTFTSVMISLHHFADHFRPGGPRKKTDSEVEEHEEEDSGEEDL